jgi:thiamine-phosphate pyrophosphorylase
MRAVDDVAGRPGRAALRDRLAAARLYLCMNARRREGDLDEFLDTVLAAGIDVVQLREKGLEAREEIALAERFADAARRHGRLFSINDRADVAHVVRPDVLHLGQDDLPVAAAREILGHDVLVGRSSHAPAEVDVEAADPGVDYFCVGPCWPTPTKPGRPAPGLPLLAHAAQSAGDKPWFAIGGIDLTTIDEVVEAGARRVVVVRAVTEADDPAAAVRELRARLSAAAPPAP